MPSKIAYLTVAIFGASALAIPMAAEAGYEVEAREFDNNNDLEAREFFEMADSSLDARDVEGLDLEVREDFDELEAREPASALLSPQTPSSQSPITPKTPKTPMTPKTPSTPVTSRLETKTKTSKTTKSDSKLAHLSPHQRSVVRAKAVAAKKFQDPKVYKKALLNKDSKLHKLAVLKYLSKPKHLKTALANKKSPYHKVAKRVLHRRKAKVYLSDKHNYKKALTHKHHKYHKDAVRKYLRKGDHFEYSLLHKKAKFHKAAVREYLLDRKIRKSILSNPDSPFYKQARKMQRKINRHHRRHHRHHKVSSDSPPADSTTSTKA